MKLRSFLLFLIALGFLASTTQANFWSLIRNYSWDHEEKEEEEEREWTYNWGDRDWTEDDKTEKYDRIWNYLCGGEKENGTAKNRRIIMNLEACSISSKKFAERMNK